MCVSVVELDIGSLVREWEFRLFLASCIPIPGFTIIEYTERSQKISDVSQVSQASSIEYFPVKR